METKRETWVQHPGYYIKLEMEARGLLQRDLAFVMDCPEQALNMILSGKRGISPDMANLLGEAFDIPGEFFLNLQKRYDLAHAKIPDPGVAVRRRMQSAYPVREMIKRGWIEPSDTKMLETQLARFFEVETPDDIPYMAHAAKKSRYEEGAEPVPPAQLAWLFRVRQIAKSVSVPAYSEKAVRVALRDLESLLTAPEQVRHVPKMLMECGIRFVLVEKLPGANIDGVCFWLDRASPVIGMTTRRDKIDNFWFVLRHEIEHVLLKHGRDREVIDTDLEGDRAATDESVPAEERAANAAGADFCISTQTLNLFMARKHPFYYERDVVAFAHLHHRHPGLVVGQMQRRMNNYAYLTRYLVKVRHFVTLGSIVDGWGAVAPVSI